MHHSAFRHVVVLMGAMENRAIVAKQQVAQPPFMAISVLRRDDTV